ncbi:MAG: GNAT family N-acetyltransferase [Ruminococcus sp.]|nr:GNAT family N-acetyltransferase [Ruminococcus sp.]
MPDFREITASDDKAIAALIRNSLKKHGLDIPGTVYFDKELDHLSEYYGKNGRKYFVIENDSGRVVGGIGFAPFDGIKDAAELQKLYLEDSAQGAGLGYEMIRFIENEMIKTGFKVSYLETHDNLKAAVHIYIKSGYTETDRPNSVVHSTMNRFFTKKL